MIDEVLAKFPYAQPYRDLKNCRFPDIDFAKHSIFNFNYSASGCGRPSVTKNFSINPADEEFIANFVVSNTGSCEMAIILDEWYLVSAFPSNYKETIKVEQMN